MYDPMPAQTAIFENQLSSLDIFVEQPWSQFKEIGGPALSTIYPEQRASLRLSDEQIEVILDGCRLNQRSAQKKLYRTYYNYALSLALPYSSGYDNAVEIINQAFLKIYRRLRNFVPGYDYTITSFTRTLKKVVENEGLDQIGRFNTKKLNGRRGYLQSST
jgi:hypothetical protein